MSAFNGAGTFVIAGVGLPYVTGTTISSTVGNQLNTDLATGLSNCITKDGQTTPIANIPMAGFKLTGLGVATAPGDALSFGNPATVSNLIVTGTLTASGSPANLIINGDMRLTQAANGGVINGGGGGNQFPVDRWLLQCSLAGKLISNRVAGQSTLIPADFYSYFEVTATYAVAPSADYFLFSQKIEGLNCESLKWGTAFAKPIALSFWAVGQTAGNFGGSISNSAQDRAYPFLYTINLANVWEQKIILIPGDQAGVWLNDSGIGMHVRFSLGVGGVRQAAAGAWTGTANIFSAIGEQAFVGFAVGKSMGISAVKVEIGGQATPFVPDDIAVSLTKCQRYFFRLDVAAVEPLATFAAYGGLNCNGKICDFPVQMRAAPTVIDTGGLVGWNATQTGNSAFNAISYSASVRSLRCVSSTLANAGTIVTGQPVYITGGGGASSFACSAEL